MSAPTETPLLWMAFPDQADRIESLRRIDSDLDELCSDFTAIAELAEKHDRQSFGEDIDETMRGLRQEIEAILNNHTNDLT